MCTKVVSMICKFIQRHTYNNMYISRGELERWMRDEGIDYSDVFTRK